MSPSLQVYSNDLVLKELYHRLSIGALRIELLKPANDRYAQLQVTTSNTNLSFVVMAYEPTIKHFNSLDSVDSLPVEASVPV